tara:strand:- start:373 stop:1353 length:981 start_codon:yes stop_codon:yes gene_type:complete
MDKIPKINEFKKYLIFNTIKLNLIIFIFHLFLVRIFSKEEPIVFMFSYFALYLFVLLALRINMKNRLLLTSFLQIVFIGSILNFLISQLIQDRILEIGLFYFLMLIFSFLIFIYQSRTSQYTKSIGLAIHLNNDLNLSRLWKKFQNTIDFIHLDYIDEEFASDNIAKNLPVVYEIKNLWPDNLIQLHIMSKDYKNVINKLNEKNIDYYIHEEFINLNSFKLDDNLGAVITTQTDESRIEEIMRTFRKIMILCVEKPGYSGQKFDNKIVNKIHTVNNLKNNHVVTLDGGMNPKIAKKFNVELIAASSSLMNTKLPFLHIAHYQLKIQ